MYSNNRGNNHSNNGPVVNKVISEGGTVSSSEIFILYQLIGPVILKTARRATIMSDTHTHSTPTLGITEATRFSELWNDGYALQDNM